MNHNATFFSDSYQFSLEAVKPAPLRPGEVRMTASDSFLQACSSD